MGEVKVIGSSKSLFCARVEWALKLKRVEYEYLQEDLLNKSPLLLKHNPVHKKTWKDYPLLPEDPYERAMARFWAKFADEKCVMGAFAAFWKEGEEKEKAIESALESFTFLEKQIQGKKFFSGDDNIGYLDLVMGWIPLWLNVMEEAGGMKLMDAQKFPFLHEWTQNFIEIPLIKECLPPRDALVNYFNLGMSYIRSMAAAKQ
ncbi:hypothetical protein H0E87_021449 [Populus deltoides]|uniref:glutathione transferase n=1 Tax=Populus deltoides TaxID=3696 RepID=A0A8T2XFG2_POPDE|nr:hypothetical protein H0E87_021449 [Populus deltoides]